MTVDASKVDPAHTSDLLIDAAERLIGEFGVDAVSIRSINTAAGQNAAAVHYHFGSKEALVAAVIERRMAVVAERRRLMLAALEVESVTPLGLARAIVLPLVEIQELESWGDAYIRFLAAIHRAGQPWSDMTAPSFAPQRERIDRLLRLALPGLPDHIAAFRYESVARLVLAALADVERFAHFPKDESPSRRTEAGALIDFVAGGLAASHSDADASSSLPQRSDP